MSKFQRLKVSLAGDLLRDLHERPNSLFHDLVVRFYRIVEVSMTIK